MKLTTQFELYALLEKAKFNSNNIEIADYALSKDGLVLMFESKLNMADEANLALSPEDVDTLVERFYDDGRDGGLDYLRQINIDSRSSSTVRQILKFIQGYVFMAVRVERKVA